MMNCTRARELLPLLLYDDLAPTEAEETRAHLRDCAACGQEFAALGGVRQALDALPAPSAKVDLGRVYVEAERRQRLQVRRWRRIAVALTAVAALLVLAFGLKLELRFEGHQVTLRWGKLPAQSEPVPPTRPEAPPPAVSAEDIQLLKGLLHGLMADMQDRDRQQQQALVRLHSQLESLQRHSQQRWAATERDLAALYTAQFGGRDKGD